MGTCDGLGTSFTRVDESHASRILLDLYGVGNSRVERLRTEKDDTYRVSSFPGHGWQYILKIAHPAERPELIDLQTAAMEHTARRFAPGRIPRVFAASNGDTQPRVSVNGIDRSVRMMSYLPGSTRGTRIATPDQRFQMGGALAMLGQAMADFEHPHARRATLWDVQNIALLSEKTTSIVDKERRETVRQLLDRVSDVVVGTIQHCRKQVIHADFNLDNVLVASDDPAYVTGIIDFGDVVHSYRVWDVAVGLAYETPSAHQVRDAWDPLLEMLRGYQHRSSLSGDELNLLPTLILARLLQRYIIGTWLATRVPENAVYTTRHHDAIWNQIDNIARAESRMQNPE